jgi:hypothetical protein
MIKDAVACHFDEGEAPKIIRLHGTMSQRRGKRPKEGY